MEAKEFSALENVTKAVKRLNAIDWELNDSHAVSSIMLLEEYCRRSAIWAKALNWLAGSGWPFFDLPEYLEPSIETDPIVIEALKNWKNRGGSALTKRMCKNHLYWAALKHKPELIELNLPEPYEPLIRIFERGGSLWRELDFIQIGEAKVGRKPFSYYLELSPMLDLDEDTLNLADNTTLT